MHNKTIISSKNIVVYYLQIIHRERSKYLIYTYINGSMVHKWKPFLVKKCVWSSNCIWSCRIQSSRMYLPPVRRNLLQPCVTGRLLSSVSQSIDGGLLTSTSRRSSPAALKLSTSNTLSRKMVNKLTQTERDTQLGPLLSEGKEE